jgi:hypothetical protein
VVSFTPPPLYFQGNSPFYPFDRRLGGPQSRSGRGGEEKNSQKATEDWRKLHNVEFHCFYSSPYIARVVKSSQLDFWDT